MMFVDKPASTTGLFNTYRNLFTAERDPAYGLYSETSIIEEYIEGTEHSISGIATESEIFILGISDKKIDKEKRIQYQNKIPSDLAEDVKDGFANITRDAILALGLENTGFHVDLILSPNGPKVLEVGARFGGECINSHLIPKSYGVCPYKLLLRYLVTGENIDIDRNIFRLTDGCKAVCRHVYPKKGGKIISLGELQKKLNIPFVEELCVTKQIGENIAFPPDSYFDFSVCTIIARFDRQNNNQKKLDNIIDQLDILTDSS